MNDDRRVQIQPEAAERGRIERALAIDDDARAGNRFSPSPPDRWRIRNQFTTGERAGVRGVVRGVGVIDVRHALGRACH
jgi:hypothetical protein